MRIQLLSRHDADPQPADLDWDTLADRFTVVTRTSRPKKDLPAWVPACLDGTQQRQRAHTIEVTALVLDIDHALQSEALEILRRIQEAGLEAFYHSTYSHDPLAPEYIHQKTQRKCGEYCYRLIVQLSRPVPVADWDRFRTACVRAFGAADVADAKTRDPCRLYYVPACPEDGPEPDSGRLRGKPLDVDLVLQHAVNTNAPAVVVDRTATQMDIESIVPRDPSRIANEFLRKGYEGIRRALDGKPYADDGERDNTLFAMAQCLANRLTYHTAESIAAVLGPCIDFAYAGDSYAPTSATFLDKLQRAQQAVKEGLKGEDPIRMRQLGREGPYTPEEISEYMKEHNCATAEELAAQLIIDHLGDLYVFSCGDYVQCSSGDKSLAFIRQQLRLAQTLPGVQLREVDSKGTIKEKALTTLMRDYGVAVRLVVPTFTLQRSRLDNGVFHYAVCPRRNLAPAYDETVNRWLERFQPANRLMDWLATAPKLERPTAALFLFGSKYTGKTLLGHSLAQIWGDAPTELRSLVNFNGDLTSNPIVMADETMPQEFREDSGLLRHLITSHSTKLRRKYLNEVNLKGAVRIIIAKNNLELFDNSEESLTAEDVDALCERLLFVDAGRDPVPDGLNPHKVACHILWLEANRVVQPAGRLWVEGSDSPLHRNMRISSRSRAIVCQWLIGMLDNPAIIADHRNLFKLDEKGLAINPRLIYARYEAYCNKERQLSLSAICKVVREIANPRGRGMYQISLDDLAQYGQSHGYDVSASELGSMCVAASKRIQMGAN